MYHTPYTFLVIIPDAESKFIFRGKFSGKLVLLADTVEVLKADSEQLIIEQQLMLFADGAALGYTVLWSFVGGMCCNFLATCLVATFYHNDHFQEITGV